jgi:MoxR-like ATPase
VTGVSVFNQKSGDFEFREGPAFVNILLVDEINRATPRTQSALLEAMGERQVTVDGITRPLPRPFLVLATQNPIEFEGTFPLPEAQLDRFLLRLQVGHPTLVEERRILRNLQLGHPIEWIEAVAGRDELLKLQQAVMHVYIDDSLIDYIGRIVVATRAHPDCSVGASTRGSLALMKTAQALAALLGRNYVIPDDVKALAPVTLAHRLMLKPESQMRGRTPTEVIASILDAEPVPIEEPTDATSGSAMR